MGSLTAVRSLSFAHLSVHLRDLPPSVCLLQNMLKTALQSRRFIVVLLPERFRAGCAFGAGTGVA